MTAAEMCVIVRSCTTFRVARETYCSIGTASDTPRNSIADSRLFHARDDQSD